MFAKVFRMKEAVHEWLAAQPKNIFFWGHKEVCATMEEEHWKARRLCWKIMLLQFSVFIEIKFVSVVRVIIDTPTYFSMKMKTVGSVESFLPTKLYGITPHTTVTLLSEHCVATLHVFHVSALRSHYQNSTRIFCFFTRAFPHGLLWVPYFQLQQQ